MEGQRRFTADGKILLYDSKVVSVFLSCPIFRAGSHYAITCINLRLFHGILGSNWVTNCANSFCYYLIGPNFAGPNCVILGAGVKLGPALIKTGDLKAATLKKKNQESGVIFLNSKSVCSTRTFHRDQTYSFTRSLLNHWTWKDFYLRVKESLLIKKHKPTLNDNEQSTPILLF